MNTIKPESSNPKPGTYLALLAILLLGASLRFYHLGQAPLWLDEQCQLWVASQPTLGEVWEATRKAGPIGRASYLDSALAWRVFGATRAGFRFPDAIAGILTLALVYIAGARWFSSRVGLFAAAMLAVSALHINYSREARGYALWTLLVLLQALCFESLARTPDFPRAISLLLITALALAVHPLAAVASLGLALGALAALTFGADPAEVEPGTKASFSWSKSAAWTAGSMLLGAFAAYALCYRGPIVTDLSPTHPAHSLSYDLVDVYKALIGGYWGIGSYLIFAAFAVGLFNLVAKSDRRWPLLLCMGVTLAAALPVISAHHFQSWVTPRYSLFALPFVFLIAGAGLDCLLGGSESRSQKSHSLLHALVPPILAGMLIGCMVLQGRCPYDLEKYKYATTSADWPSIDRP